MRTLILLLLLIIAFQFSQATELPLLNLEIGKTYHIETTTHVDTSEQWPYRLWEHKKWEFTPMTFDAKSETYKIKAVLKFYQHVIQRKFDYRGWMEEEVYETGYLGSYRSPLVYLSENEVPVYFMLNKNGYSSDFDFGAFTNFKTPEGSNLEIYADYQPQIADGIRRIFKPDVDLFILEPSKGYKNLSSNELVKENDEQMVFNYFPGRDIKSPYRFLNCEVVVDKLSGLVLRNHYNYLFEHHDYSNALLKDGVWNHAVYYQKYIPEYNTNFKALNYKPYGGSSDTIIPSSNFVLEGQLTNRIEGADSIFVSLIKEGINFQLPLDQENRFRLELKMADNHKLQLIYAPIRFENRILNKEDWSRIKKSMCSLSVEPGDHLKLEFDSRDTLKVVNVSGLGSRNNMSSIEKIANKYRFNSSSGSRKLPVKIENELKNQLTIRRSFVSPQTYINDVNVLTYSKTNLPKELDKDFTNTLLVNNTLAKGSKEYLKIVEHFIDNTLDASIRLGTGVDWYNYGAKKENTYHLAQIALAEPVASYFLADNLKKIIAERQWDLSERLFQSFKLNYSDKPVFYEVEKVYNEYRKIAPGQAAPDFEITDLNGKKFGKQTFKKHVVVFAFYNALFDQFGSNRKDEIKSIQNIYNQIADGYPNMVRFVLIFGGSSEKANEFRKELPSAFEIYTDQPFPKPGMFVDYKANSSSVRYFILDRNGTISYSNPSWYAGQLPSTEIEKALAIPYKSENELPVWLRITLIALIGALISIVLTFIFYRTITKRRLKKSEMNKKMRELELTAIRAQMNPHFMYNCLNSIQNLVQKQQNDEAHLYLSKFASLIRRTLNTSKKEEITLAEELETINEYIELEKLRFEFDFVLNIEPKVEINSVFVPPMLLQPFVENALLHGLVPKSKDRNLSIKIFKKEKQVCIEMEDNGVGRTIAVSNGTAGNGKGLILSQERLALLEEKYKTSYHFEIIDLKDENGLPLGTKVSLCFVDE
ncbi:MAG: histidine kinase [Prolixibacteraceae bacterium]